MLRLLLTGSLATAALAGLAALPAHADRQYRNKLDDEGKPIGANWSPTGRFEGLISAGSDNVRLTSGQRWQIRATGDAKTLSQLRFMIENGSLIVGRVSGQRTDHPKVQIEITAPSIESVTGTGSGTLEVARIAADNARITVAGSGRTLVRQIDAERLAATVAGSGTLDLAGRSDSANLTIAGSGALSAPDLTVGTAKITVAGSGGGQFRSSGPVRATIVGSGTVNVRGTTDCSQTRIGSGRLLCNR